MRLLLTIILAVVPVYYGYYGGYGHRTGYYIARNVRPYYYYNYHTRSYNRQIIRYGGRYYYTY